MTDKLRFNNDNIITRELSDKALKDLESEVKLPYIMKDKILMSPGVWNNFYYSSEFIDTLFKKSNWDDPKVKSLFLDHIDNEASEWIGEVTNPVFSNGNITGDLAILDKPTAIKLAYGAKFGISPKVAGEADNNRRMYDGIFENFSVVVNPAVKTAFLNSEIKIGGNTMAKEDELQGSEASADVNEPKKDKVEPKTAEEKEKETNELAERVAEILKDKFKPEEVKKENADEEVKKDKYPEELAEEITKLKEKIAELEKKKDPQEEELSEYTDFVKDYLGKHKGESIKDAAAAWGKEHKELEEKSSVTAEDMKTHVGEMITNKLSEFGIKNVPIAAIFINPSDKGYNSEIESQELDKAMFSMLQEGSI